MVEENPKHAELVPPRGLACVLVCDAAPALCEQSLVPVDRRRTAVAVWVHDVQTGVRWRRLLVLEHDPQATGRGGGRVLVLECRPSCVAGVCRATALLAVRHMCVSWPLLPAYQTHRKHGTCLFFAVRAVCAHLYNQLRRTTDCTARHQPTPVPKIGVLGPIKTQSTARNSHLFCIVVLWHAPTPICTRRQPTRNTL